MMIRVDQRKSFYGQKTKLGFNRAWLRGWFTVSSMFITFSTHAITPVIDYAAIAQLTSQLTQLKTQTEYIQQQLKVLDTNQYQWSNAQGLINQLGTIVNQTNGIAYSGKDINQRFQQAYPGYQAPTDFNQQYQNNVNTTQNTLNGVLQSVGANAADFENENKRLAFLQLQSQSAQGQTQAIQASSQIASETVTQIQLLRQITIAQTNAQTAYYATRLQNEASARAEQDEILQGGSRKIVPYGSSGHYLSSPNF